MFKCKTALLISDDTQYSVFALINLSSSFSKADNICSITRGRCNCHFLLINKQLITVYIKSVTPAAAIPPMLVLLTKVNIKLIHIILHNFLFLYLHFLYLLVNSNDS